MFEIWSHGKLLGETELEVHDEGMNVRRGRFYPRQDYFTVRAVFQAYAAALDLKGAAQHNAMADYYKQRDALDLTIQDRGRVAMLAGAIHINDLVDPPDELEVEIYPP